MRACYAMSHNAVYTPSHYSALHSAAMSPFDLIAALIRESGKSTLQIAKEMSGPSFQGTLHKFASGGVKSPSHTTAKKMADYFDLPIEAIYDRAVSTRIARERGLTAGEPWRLSVADNETISLKAMERTPDPRPHLNANLVRRIGQLSTEQLRSLETMIKAYLDAVEGSSNGKASNA